MTNPRKNVQDMIRRRLEKNKKIRDNINENRTNPPERVYKFLTEFDDKLNSTQDTLDKIDLIDLESRTLLTDLRASDPMCSIEMVWFGDDEEALRLSGVRVTWGEEYKKKEGIVYDDTLFDVVDALFRS